MTERAAKKGLEKLIELEKMFKRLKVEIIYLILPPTGLLEDSEEYNPTDFLITIHGMDYSSIFINTKNKTAEAYPSRIVQQELSMYPKEKVKRLTGRYREAINTLRRHDYKIKFKKILVPQDPQIVA